MSHLSHADFLRFIMPSTHDLEIVLSMEVLWWKKRSSFLSQACGHVLRKIQIDRLQQTAIAESLKQKRGLIGKQTAESCV
jgi:hypothetical protein